MSHASHLAPCELTPCSPHVAMFCVCLFLSPFLVNMSTLELVGTQEINITGPDRTEWELHGLTEGSLYRFLLSACTRAGCGPALAMESNTPSNARE